MLTECPDCEKHFRGPVCACGYRKSQPAPQSVWKSPEWLSQPKPCTAEENYRAAQLIQAILTHEVTVDQARSCLHEMFQGREKEL